jgi:hypothetical protein
MKNANASFLFSEGDDSDSNIGFVKPEYSIPLSVLITLIACVFVGYSSRIFLN